MKVHWFTLLLIHSFLVSCLFAFEGGGTEEFPYLISTPEDLHTIAADNSLWTSCFEMTGDIDLAGTPIACIERFRGVFDGGGYAIYNYEPIDPCSETYMGFFGVLKSSAVVKNLTFVNPRIDCTIPAVPRYVGLLAGRVESGSILNCHIRGGYVKHQYTWPTSSYGDTVGSVAGEIYPDMSIHDCSVKDTTVIGSEAGGIAGTNLGTIQGCRVERIIVDGSIYAGGVCGNNQGTIFRCIAQGDITAKAYAGGLAGINNGYPPFLSLPIRIINESWANCNVYSNDNSGGLVGTVGNVSSVINCYSMGMIDGTLHKAGLISCVKNGAGADPQIENCFSIAKLVGSTQGGLISHVHTDGGPVTVSNSYWDVNVSGASSSARGTGETTPEMQLQSTFASWNFENVWYMGAYPLFQWELNPLQVQIDAAVDGDVIVVEPGIYEGPLFFKGKNITLTSTDPTDSAVVAATVLQGRGNSSVVTFAGTENDTCALAGFTITGGSSLRGGGICANSAQAGISHCVIQNNTATYGGGIADCLGKIEKCVISSNSGISNGGGLVKCAGLISNCLIVNNTAVSGAGLNNCDGVIVNCTIADNTATSNGGGLRRCDGAVSNSVIWSNSPDDQFECTNLTYCCYKGAVGGGNLNGDPLFVDPTAGDYRLQQESPCIDTGDPASDYSNEPMPNGECINMGFYGNTPEAAIKLLVPQEKILAADGKQYDRFGESIAFDGDVAIIGAEYGDGLDGNTGSAYIFRYDGITWVQEAELMAADGTGYERFGHSVSISNDVAIVGAFEDDDRGQVSGSAYIFRYNGTIWTQEIKLIATDTVAWDQFGKAVAIDGNVAIVGAPGNNSNGHYAGAVYIFRFHGSSWVQQTKLFPPPSAHYSHLGISVAIDGNYMIAGGYYENNNLGAAYIYHYDGATWIQQAHLSAGGSDSPFYFGGSVSISKDSVIVGATNDNGENSSPGFAYIFKRIGSSWIQQARLSPADGMGKDHFGHSVSIADDVVIVGSEGDDDFGEQSGSAYIFRYDGSSWTQRAKLSANDAESSNYFGWSVDINKGRFMVGAYGDENYAGSVYLFGERAPEYLTVCGLETISKQEVNPNVFEYIYQLAVTNSHVEPVSDVTVTLLSDCDNMTIVDGEVLIDQIAVGQTIVASDTITVQVDRADGPAAAEWLIGHGDLTTQATQPVTLGLLADIIADGIVDEQDLLRLIQSWMTADSIADVVSAPGEPVDFVNMNDFRVLSEEWKK